ncbi:putative hyoscyamine 6-dioxygenase-like [Capsicum annuum]|uniref:UBA domain-containing protein n=1 Tax=Capsicum annuum TaxID=4072 RepID=A0A2G2ZD58_CAPAN|nr:uncharacterized protein LOC107875726 [Capsicum annuum]XP_016578030.2 uncharacterized protein LOC107875726 [Capsicum annuum]KAF3662818.1 putative hyoscyamine 6-dioxygenase-like [Capsicum annuum]PHT79957.1 hypothetical protein T459_18009 [Capsicum annuum]
MSPASRSKSKDKKGGKETPKAASKPSSVNAGSTVPTSGYNPLLGTFHTLETAPVTSNAALHVNGRFRNIDETDDHSGHSLGPSNEYDSVSNNGSWSGESEDHKEKMSHPPPRIETVPGSDNDKREKIRQKNEKKHQRQKERRAQELHEKCSGYLMSRKLEALAQQLVAMGFSSERATMALIFNEGRVEESVAWLFEGGEEADKHKERNLDGGGNLKIDISEELARITDMEIRYKCSKQEVERTLVACEGDLEKAEETLRSQKQELHSAPSKPDESGDPPTVGNGKLPNTTSQNLVRAPAKPSPNIILPKRDDRDFNYTKVTATSGSSADNGSKSIQSLKRVQPKLEWAKPPQVVVPADKRWLSAGTNPSVSYSLASPLQASPQSSKSEARYVAVGNELKNLQLGTVREPVIVMQRPNQSINPKQTPTSSISSSPPGTTAGWFSNNTVETMKPNRLMSHIPGTRSMSLNGVSTNQLYSQLQYQQHQQPQQFVSSSGPLESPGTSRGNSLWSRTGALQTQTLSAASSLGLFSGLGTNSTSGSSSPVDWNSGGGSMVQLDYANIDWSLDRGSSSSRTGGMWPAMNPLMQNNGRTYDSFTPALGVTSAMRPVLSNGGGVSIPGLQERAATVETSTGGSREWTSPFEEKDLFSLPRQFVSSPSL